MSTGPKTNDPLEAGHAPTPGRVRHERDGSGESLAVLTPAGHWVHLHGRRDPASEADRLVAPLFEGGAAPPAVFVIGPGLGYAVEAVERRSPRTRIIALEPFADAARAMRARRARAGQAESPHLRVLVGPDYGSGDAWRLVEAGAAAPVLVHPVLRVHFPAEVARAEVAARRVIEGAAANDEARRRFAAPYLLNTLANLPALWREGDVADLRGALAGMPAVVVGAGPSLDAALEPLARVRDRVVVIAVDTTLRPLLAAGIEPHFVVAVDPQEANARHLRGVAAERTWLVTEGSLPASVLEPFRRRTFLFQVSDHHPWPWLRVNGADRGKLRAWGSVLTSAFDLALSVGCDPIAFVGADLAYTGGQMYCRNTIYDGEWASYATAEARQDAIARRLASLVTATEPDVAGAPTLTTPHFLQFRDWIAAAAAEAAPVRVVNATGAGILHGAAIERCTPADLDRLAGRDGDARARIARAWRRAPERAKETSERLTRAVADAWFGAELVRAWIDFSAGLAAEDAVRRRLASATLARLAETVDAEDWRVQAPRDEASTGAEALYWLGADTAIEPWPPEREQGADEPPWREASALGAEVAATWWSRTPLASEGALRAPMPHLPRQLRTLVGAAIRLSREPIDDAETRTVTLCVARTSAAAPAERISLPPFRVPAARLLRFATGTLVRRTATRVDAAVPAWVARPFYPAAIEIGTASADDSRTAALSLDLVPLPSDEPGEIAGYAAPIEPFAGGRIGCPVEAGDDRVILTRLLEPRSWLLDAEGGIEEAPAWPEAVRGQLPWGPDGGAIAWTEGRADPGSPAPASAWWRDRAGAPPRRTVLPFRPGTGVVLEDGRVACSCLDGGLATFAADGRTVHVSPQQLFSGPVRDGAGVVVSGITRGSRRLSPVVAPRACCWDTRSEGVGDGPTHSTAGPTASRAVRGAWTADAHFMASVVRLTRAGGMVLDLTCHEPIAVAWAGDSLVVGLMGWNVLLFRGLARRLEALARSAGTAVPAGGGRRP